KVVPGRPRCIAGAGSTGRRAGGRCPRGHGRRGAGASVPAAASPAAPPAGRAERLGRAARRPAHHGTPPCHPDAPHPHPPPRAAPGTSIKPPGKAAGRRAIGPAQTLNPLALSTAPAQPLPEAASHPLLSAEVAGNLAGLDGLPQMTREAAIGEVGTAVAGLLD